MVSIFVSEPQDAGSQHDSHPNQQPAVGLPVSRPVVPASRTRSGSFLVGSTNHVFKSSYLNQSATSINSRASNGSLAKPAAAGMQPSASKCSIDKLVLPPDGGRRYSLPTQQLIIEAKERQKAKLLAAQESRRHVNGIGSSFASLAGIFVSTPDPGPSNTSINDRAPRGSVSTSNKNLLYLTKPTDHLALANRRHSASDLADRRRGSAVSLLEVRGHHAGGVQSAINSRRGSRASMAPRGSIVETLTESVINFTVGEEKEEPPKTSWWRDAHLTIRKREEATTHLYLYLTSVAVGVLSLVLSCVALICKSGKRALISFVAFYAGANLSFIFAMVVLSRSSKILKLSNRVFPLVVYVLCFVAILVASTSQSWFVIVTLAGVQLLSVITYSIAELNKTSKLLRTCVTSLA